MKSTSLGNKVIVYSLAGIMALTTAFSAIGCKTKEEVIEEVNNVTPVTETVAETEETIIEEEPEEEKTPEQLFHEDLSDKYSKGFADSFTSLDDKLIDIYKENKDVMASINFFNERGLFDGLMDKRPDEESLTDLYDILNQKTDEEINNYMDDVLDPRNDNPVAIIVNASSTLANGYASLPAYVFEKIFNIDNVLIIANSNKPSEKAKTMDMAFIGMIESASQYLESKNQEIEQAFIEGSTDSIKVNLNGDQIIALMKEKISDPHTQTAYIFKTGHSGSNGIAVGKPALSNNDYITGGNIDEVVDSMNSGGKVVGLYNGCDIELVCEVITPNEDIDYIGITASNTYVGLSDLPRTLHYTSRDGFVFGKEFLDVAEGVGASIFEEGSTLSYDYHYDGDFIFVTKKDSYGNNFKPAISSNIEGFDIERTNSIVYNITSIE